MQTTDPHPAVADRRTASEPRRLLIPLAIAGLVLLWGLPWIIAPLSTDEAYYALGGRAILEGDRLYNDLWDIKPPLIYVLYAIPLAVFGDHSEGIRVFTLLSTTAGAGALYFLSRRFFERRAAILAVALYGFAHFSLAGFEAQGEAESFMVAPLLLAFAVYQPRDGARNALPAAVAAGALLGIVIALKFSALLLVLGLPLAELLFRDRADWTRRGAIIRLACAAGGFFVVQLGWVAYLLAAGVWSDFVDIQVNYTIPYARFRWAPEGVPYWRAVIESTAGWLRDALYISAPAWAAFFFGLLRGPRAPVLFFGCMALLSVLAVWWQGKLFHYHWLMLVPFLAVLAGYALDRLVAAGRTLGQGSYYAVAGLVGFGLLIAGLSPLLRFVDDYDFLRLRIAGSVSQEDVDDRYFGELRLNRELVDYIRANGDAGDQFYIWGFWITPYFWEDRPLVTRFVANHGLRSRWTPPEWRNDLLDDLEAVRPRFVAIAAGDLQPWLTGTEESSDQHFCQGFPELSSFVSQSYQPVLNNGLFVLYDWEAPAPSAFPRCAE